MRLDVRLHPLDCVDVFQILHTLTLWRKDITAEALFLDLGCHAFNESITGIPRQNKTLFIAVFIYFNFNMRKRCKLIDSTIFSFTNWVKPQLGKLMFSD
jgi:hypothetical protein